MPITLQEAKVGMADKVDQQVVDAFRRSSLLLDSLVFDNAISPGTGGSTLTYGYIQLKSPSTAAVRTINNEYTPGEAKREEKTSTAIIMGGSFEIDRVIQDTAGAVDEMAFQMEQKVKATSNEFTYLAINGKKDSGSETGFKESTFDGLNKLLASSDTEVTSTVDVSDSTKMDTNYNALLDELDATLSLLDGKPTLLIMNNKMLTKVRAAARRAGYYARSRDEFGRTVETYNDIPMMDAGEYYDGSSTKSIIQIDSNGKTDIYAVSIGIDGFHGISPTGTKVVKSYLPDMSQPGAVKKGEVELIAGVVLKNTRKACVLRGVKVNP